MGPGDRVPAETGGAITLPKVLGITMPKSGTHLLDSILGRIPPMRRHQRAGFDYPLKYHPFNWIPFAFPKRATIGIARQTTVPLVAIDHCLGRIRRGRYALGLIPFQPQVYELARRRGITLLVLTRDPRDILISKLHHVSSHRNHYLHGKLLALPDDRARLKALLYGSLDEETAPLSKQMRYLLGWLENTNALRVRFEDLIGVQGDGDAQIQCQVIQQIGDYIGIPLSAERAAHIGRDMFGKGRTFRKGKIGGWRDYFDDDFAQRFYRETADGMAALGYDPSIPKQSAA